MARRLVIDSRCRRSGETADAYTIDFPAPLRAESIELVKAFVPFVAPTISTGCDTFLVSFQDDPGADAEWTRVRLDPGDVANAPDLADRVQTALQNAVPNRAATVTIVTDNRLRFSADSQFSIVPSTVSIAKLLGLRPPALAGRDEGRKVPQTSSPAPDVPNRHALDAQFRLDLSADTYLVLSLDVAGALESPMHAVSGCTALVQSGWQDVAVPVRCATVRREVSRMRVTITRADGSPYEFRGADNVLEFSVR